MTSRNHIPQFLEPYLRLPPETSLIVLTGTLGCSTTWLTARFTGSVSGSPDVKHNALGNGTREDIAVVLVSFLRDAAFWKGEMRRTMGIDTTKLSTNGRFIFVDCLNTLTNVRPEAVLEFIEKNVTDATRRASRPVFLVIDSPDILLALNLATALDLDVLLLKLRKLAHSALVACCADLPFMAAATQGQDVRATPIETETASFVVKLAHNARFVMGLRELDTGAAKDVSGVLRITRGAAAYESEEEVKEMEALYLVGRDGSAKVYERGAVAA
ncbi:hypothetical protein EJ03DRAFT_263914 [Teratosphaeria nubilosa]|uniref:Elongator complex protein 6 n=1 Tax=Teratosphaeria nubilosa TaxID=161662 RepID=A0A6G1LLZ6_9PEZI|nr:hypothetical protein EJ03DRAFT_263914 [Teratosphaeria nubilosa]